MTAAGDHPVRFIPFRRKNSMSRRPRGPNASEAVAQAWLEQIGCTSVEFVGGELARPDFRATFCGHAIAVEVSRLMVRQGRREEQERGFERRLEEIVASVTRPDLSAPQWRCRCEYDPRQPCPPVRRWHRMRKHIICELRQSEGYREIQLVPGSERVGRGITLILEGLSESGGVTQVHSDQGVAVLPSLFEAIQSRMEEKNRKDWSAVTGLRWLVLEDVDHMSSETHRILLGNDERVSIERAMQHAAAQGGWSKVIVISRWRSTPTAAWMPVWAIWEDPLHRPLAQVE